MTERTFERPSVPGVASTERAPARVWLLSIAHNLLIDHYRADRHDDRLSLANVQQILSRSLRRLRERLQGAELDRSAGRQAKPS